MSLPCGHTEGYAVFMPGGAIACDCCPCEWAMTWDSLTEGGSIRNFCLTAPEARPRDLQAEFRLTYSQACSALEELEALRLLGSRMAGGSRVWSAGFPSDETRVLDLRRALGWRVAA